MNPLKKTIITIIAISSVSVVSVMANQDVAAQFDKWYQTAFQKSSESTFLATEAGLQEITETTKQRQQVLRENAVSKIETFLLNTSDKSKNSIKNYQNNYLSRLKKTETELERSNLDVSIENKKAQLDSEMTDDVEGMLSEILDQ
jgi:transposase-like protein